MRIIWRKRQADPFSRNLLLLVLALCFALCLASSVTSQPTPADVIYWEEELPEPLKDNLNDEEPNKRRLFWQGRMDESISTDTKKEAATAAKKTTPHSMRTNEWQLDLHMSRRERTRLGIHNKTMLLDFSETGHVRVMNNNTFTLAIGTWKLHPSGITWQFPIRQEESSPVTLQCHADLIINPFGSRPRMVRGTIVKNSRKWFRPVVATFSAEGIGQDTADMSYRERGFGL